jgi:hypothetical protein
MSTTFFAPSKTYVYIYNDISKLFNKLFKPGRLPHLR